MALPAFDASLPFEETEDNSADLPAFDPSLPFNETKQEAPKPARTIPKPPNAGAPTSAPKPVQVKQKPPVMGYNRTPATQEQPERYALTDEESKFADQKQKDLMSIGRMKGTAKQKLAIYKKKYPQDDLKEVAPWITYYEQGGTDTVADHNAWYVNEKDAGPVITVTADKKNLPKPSFGTQGAIVDGVRDAVRGVAGGVDDSVLKPLFRHGAELTDYLGATDNAAAQEQADSVMIDNNRESGYVNPDGVARTGGELVGELAPYVLASELKPFTALAPEGGALATVGDLATQGGVIGALQSDGEDVVGDVLKNAFLTGAFGAAGGEGVGAIKRASGKEGYAAPEPKLAAKDFIESDPSVNEAPTSSTPIDAPDDGLKRFLGKEGVVEPISPEPHVSDEVLGRLTQALKNAGGVKEEQAAMFKKQRAERFAAARRALDEGSGVDAFIQAKSELKGALDAPAYEGIGEQFSQADKDALALRIRDTQTLSTTGKFSAFEGLKKVMQGDIPAAKELEHLSEAFPADFLKEVMAKRTHMAKAGGVFAEVWNMPKSMMSSMDLSAPLRQGVGLIHRAEFRDAAKQMIHYASIDDTNFNILSDSIKKHPYYELAEDSGLSLTVAGDTIGPREDAFKSHYAEKIPIYGKGVQMSERGYVGFLNKLRFDTFVTLLEQAEKSGLDIRNDPKALKGVSNYINVMTGRGGLGVFEKAVEGLNLVLFSPRLISSRLQILTAPLFAPFGKGFIGDLPKELRMEAAKSYAGMGAYYTTAITLASVAGYEVVANPLSSDFGKIKDGDTRVDLGGGLLQYITAGARAIMRSSTSSTSGNTRVLNKTGDTPLDADIRFVLNKLHPSLSLIVDQQRGKNAVGEKFAWGTAILDRLIPMGAPDIYNTLKEHPNANGVLYSTLGLLGAGLQTYKSKDANTASGLPNVSDLPAFDPKAEFTEKPEDKPTEEPTKDDLPAFDPKLGFKDTSEGNIKAVSIVEGMGLKVTDDGIRSLKDQEKYYRTTEGAARPGTSEHGLGNAIDIRIPRDGTTPSDIKNALQKQGFVNVRMITKLHGTGPHWHFAWDRREEQ